MDPFRYGICMAREYSQYFCFQNRPGAILRALPGILSRVDAGGGVHEVSRVTVTVTSSFRSDSWAGFIGIMEKKMETTIVCWVFWGYWKRKWKLL